MCEREKRKAGAELQKSHRICNRIHDWGYNWECNYCYCDKPIMRVGISLPLESFTHLVPEITKMGARVKCVLFVYVKHTVYNPLDKFPLPSIHLSVVLDCALKAS